MGASTAIRLRATRQEHIARMHEAEVALVVDGKHSTVVERDLAERHGVTHRQARRYIKAVKRIYAQHAAEDILSMDEMLALLQDRAHRATLGEEPDWKASIKALELYSRLRGWLDSRSHVVVSGTIGLQPLPALDRFDAEGLAMLAKLHEHMREREVKGELVEASPEPVEPAE